MWIDDKVRQFIISLFKYTILRAAKRNVNNDKNRKLRPIGMSYIKGNQNKYCKMLI